MLALAFFGMAAWRLSEAVFGTPEAVFGTPEADEKKAVWTRTTALAKAVVYGVLGATVVGRIGGIARGIVFATAGVFLVVAAVTAQPGRAKGSTSLAGRLARVGPLQQGGEMTSKPHSFGGPGRQFVALARDLGQPLLKLDDPADGRHRHALVRHRRDLLDDADLHAGVAALAAGRALRRDDLELVDAAQERLLKREHVRDLAHGVKRDILVVKRLHVPHLPAKW